MTATYYVAPTDHGKSLIASAHNEQQIRLINLVLGDANGAPYDPLANVHRTELVNQCATVPVQSVSISPNGADTVRVVAVIPSSVGGFNIHEIGLTDETDQLVYIGNWHGGYKPVLTEGANGEILLNIDIQVTAGSQAIIRETNAVTASQDWVLNLFEQHNTHQNPHPQYAMDSFVNQFRTEILEALFLHATAANPHPQYLLASTFGVSLPMTANTTTDYTEEHEVFGWDGESGNVGYNPTESWTWGTSGSGVMIFHPYRAYGVFMVQAHIWWMDQVYLTFKTFNKNNELVEENVVRNGAGAGDEKIRHLVTIPKDGHIEMHWTLKSSYTNKGRMWANVYVDDRVKVFKPVGYQSIVDSTDEFNSGGEQQKDDYSMYPTANWFYYSSSLQVYVPIANSSLVNPVSSIPHYNRAHFELYSEIDVHVLIEAGMQSTENDYTTLETVYARASVDTNGDVVVAIPLELRSITPEAGFNLVYTVLYYIDEVEKTSSTFPTNSIDGEHKIFVNI